MKLYKKIFCILLIYFSLPLVTFAQADENWQPRDEGVEEQSDGEEKAYRLKRGYLDGINKDFKNGIIEFELNLTRERAFFYIYFRKQSAVESEVVYIRAHKSNAPGTIQYSPVYQGKSAWQLYHGLRGTASATLPHGEWVKVKMEIVGNQLSMWVGDDPEPNIKNMTLMGNKNAGGISFRGNIPRGSLAKHTGLLRNIKVHPLPSADELATSDNELKSGMISEYKVSPAFEIAEKSSTHIPKEILNKKWLSVSTDSHGALELLRHRKIPAGARTWAVAADATLNAEQPISCQVDLGFSDAITLMLNGKTELFVDSSYRYRTNRQEGLMHSKQLSVFLNLKTGDNILRAIVADSFGGWGLQAQLINCRGVKIVD